MKNKILVVRIKLLLVFLLSVFYVFVNSLTGAIIIFLLGVIVFLLTKKTKSQRILALSAFVTGAMMIVYNVVFSPKDAGGTQWFVFTINDVGLTRGFITGLRLIGVMLVSFCWLFTTSLHDIYLGFSWFKPVRPWSLLFLRGVQLFRCEIQSIVRSLLIRGLKWNSLKANIKNLLPLASVVIPRTLSLAQDSTLAHLTHKSRDGVNQNVNNGVEIKDVFVRYGSSLPDIFEALNLNFSLANFTYIAGKGRVGKTTFMRLLSGLIPSIMGQVCGNVNVLGNDPINTDLGSFCENVRYIGPDPYSSIHGLTVGQEIMLIASREEEAHKTLSIMGINHLWDRDTGVLSGGEGIRLVLAGALASKAKLLLLDSPMQELDPQGREDFLSALKILGEDFDGHIVVSDPYWEELSPHIDKVLVIESKWSVNDTIQPYYFFNPFWLRQTNLLREFPSFERPTLGKVVAKMEGVHVWLGDTHILKGFDFSAQEGEMVVIAGKNGSGKTTAMLTLANAIKRQEGLVETDRKVSYVFQHPKLQTVAMTIDKELELEPKIMGWDNDRTEKFKKEALEWLDIDPSFCPLDLHPSDKRLLMIAASGHSPIMVLDEPTIDLDSEDVLRVLKFIQKRRNEGTAVIVVTHDPVVMKLADRVVVVEEGRVINEYIPQEVKTDNHKYVSCI